MLDVPRSAAEFSASLPAILDRLPEVAAEAEAIARVSYLHPNAFDKLVLASCPERGQLRLDIWWASGPSCDLHVHPHRWAFRSHVLVGALIHRRYQTSATGERMLRYRYFPVASDGTYRVRADGEANVVCHAVDELTAGDWYDMAPSELHRVERKGGGVAATLLWHGPPVVDSTLIYSERPIPTATVERTPVRRMTPADVVASVSAVLAAMRG
jgi:hypothetical protein